MMLWVKPLVRDHPYFGIGRGAFESVFPFYRPSPGNVVYTHAENFVGQWIAEWGPAVALAALGTLAWAFAPRRLGVHRSAIAAGAWCGVVVLLVQNLVDLALEVPGVMHRGGGGAGLDLGRRAPRGARGPAPAWKGLRRPGSLAPAAGLARRRRRRRRWALRWGSARSPSARTASPPTAAAAHDVLEVSTSQRDARPAARRPSTERCCGTRPSLTSR